MSIANATVIKKYVGLSTDTKPSHNVLYGSEFYEINAVTGKVDKVYLYVSDNSLGAAGWVETAGLNFDANLQVGSADVSATNPVPVKGGTVANTTKISPTGGTKAVTTSGTAVALVASATPCTTLYVRALSTNTGNIYLGSSAVDKTTSQQIIMIAGQEISLSANAGYYMDVNEWYIDSDANAEGVDFVYF